MGLHQNASMVHQTTLQGQTNNHLKIMQPIAPNHDHEGAGALERWEERYRMLMEEDGEDKLPDTMLALRGHEEAH